jgi:ATP-dependent exoDNAse (exonuclease V) beta subunit
MRALKNILKDKDGRKILKSYKNDKAEYALTFVEGRNFRNKIVDRTYVDDDGVRWIIDYKTGEHEGSNLKEFFDDEMDRYREQLESYEQLIRLQGETRPIKKALYYPLHKRLVEIPEK